jgi:hypothetical protein
MLFDKVLERWCGVVEAGPFAMVEGCVRWNKHLANFIHHAHNGMNPLNFSLIIL